MALRVHGMAHQMLKTRAAYYDALNHAQRLRAAQYQTNERQHKVLERLLEAGLGAACGSRLNGFIAPRGQVIACVGSTPRAFW